MATPGVVSSSISAPVRGHEPHPCIRGEACSTVREVQMGLEAIAGE